MIRIAIYEVYTDLSQLGFSTIVSFLLVNICSLRWLSVSEISDLLSDNHGKRINSATKSHTACFFTLHRNFASLSIFFVVFQYSIGRFHCETNETYSNSRIKYLPSQIRLQNPPEAEKVMKPKYNVKIESSTHPSAEVWK